MAAHYDTYDYPSYWQGREYEQKSEEFAISEFIKKIPKIKKIIDIGAGYGRLYQTYAFRAKKIVLSDPSSKLLKIARKNIRSKKVDFVHSKLQNLNDQLKWNKFDLAVFVRVLHHIVEVEEALKQVNKLLKEEGYLILEFANKSHFKASVSEFFKGNFTFLIDIFPKDITSKKNVKKKTLPFINYHPDVIKQKLKESGFKIIEKRSVSNVRSPLLKKHLPPETLFLVEKTLQKPFSAINFGPSIFILAQKEKDI